MKKVIEIKNSLSLAGEANISQATLSQLKNHTVYYKSGCYCISGH